MLTERLKSFCFTIHFLKPFFPSLEACGICSLSHCSGIAPPCALVYVYFPPLYLVLKGLFESGELCPSFLRSFLAIFAEDFFPTVFSFLSLWNFIFWMINVPHLIHFLYFISLSFCRSSIGIKSVLLSQVSASALFPILLIESLISAIVALISRNSVLSSGYSFYTVASCSYLKEALSHCSKNVSSSFFLSFHVFLQ